jgi:phosphatidylglycerophosphate synthase
MNSEHFFDPLRRLAAPLVARAARARLSADSVTLAAFAAGLGAVLVIGRGWFLPGAGLILLSRILDGLDGELARATKPSHWGAYLDLVLSFILVMLLPFSFALAMPDRSLAALFLTLAIACQAMASLSFAQVATRAGHPPSRIGVLDKLAIHAAFLLACLLPSGFSIIAYTLGIVCFIALGLRLVTAHMRLP